MASRSTVGDYVTLQRGTTYKGNLVGKPGPALLGLGSIQPGGGFRVDDYKTYGGDCPPTLMLFPGDLFVSLKGATKDGQMIGSIARVPPTVSSGRLTQDTVKLEFHDSDRGAATFLYWILRTPQYRDYCAGRATGSAVVALSRDDFLAYPVPPITPTRISIVKLLETLEAKIELNRRMNATLEAMARALFQSWLVDFDPVRAKLDSRQPTGLDPATAALFPATFQDSPLGPIPHGWTAQRLPDAIDVNPRRALKTGTIAPYLDMKNLPTQGHSAEEVVQREFSSGTKFQNGDTLLARITPCLENGKTGYVDFLKNDHVGWGSTEYIVFAPKPPLPPQFGYLLARSDPLRSHAIQNMTGTSGRQRVPSECFHNFFLAVPTSEVARRFGELTAPLMARIKANSQESRTLATLRDTLLPKLLSGDVEVKPIND